MESGSLREIEVNVDLFVQLKERLEVSEYNILNYVVMETYFL
jgi:hypothetical protein